MYFLYYRPQAEIRHLQSLVLGSADVFFFLNILLLIKTAPYQIHLTVRSPSAYDLFLNIL